MTVSSRTVSTMRSGGDSQGSQGATAQQQHTMMPKTTAPLKGILVRSGNQNPYPLKILNAGPTDSQSSVPLQSNPDANIPVLKRCEDFDGNGSSVLNVGPQLRTILKRCGSSNKKRSPKKTPEASPSPGLSKKSSELIRTPILTICGGSDETKTERSPLPKTNRFLIQMYILCSRAN
ncbi:uncharacterized protein LOC113565700 isoform X1 [Drosophila persimilis]|uniref:uncharacterized protein LOC113565700 isoform X1 n=1 Tax=Drosophila persimilis TaxID=7234 RepID=UPI000F07AD06|nr:uncharacterized protein LOC113565700 isoform X1 [Drosophila persimilis]